MPRPFCNACSGSDPSVLSDILLAAESKGYAAACDRVRRQIAVLAKVALTTKMFTDLQSLQLCTRPLQLWNGRGLLPGTLSSMSMSHIFEEILQAILMLGMQL